jgi:Tol biopolymer transport system component
VAGDRNGRRDANFDILRLDLATRRRAGGDAVSSKDPAVSPDDTLLAYASEQSGRWEVYVQALGSAHGRWQISSEGGLRPRWRADGRELYFLARPDRLMAVDVEPGAVPQFSPPRELFREPIESF